MPAPLINHLLPDSTSYRAIENQYHLERIAKSADEFEKFEAERFELQRELAVENLSRLSAISGHQEEANELLAAITVTSVVANQKLQRLIHLSAGTLNAVQQGLATIAVHLFEQKRLLAENLALLRQPYNSQVKELLFEADRALDAGMAARGQEREAEFADATKLVSAALANPIGSRDADAWFQYGWLLWHYKAKVDEAESAFYHAARLSKGKADLQHLKSLRHAAHMQYLQAKYNEAYQTISPAVAETSDYEIIMEGARYAAKANHDNALSLLDRCIAIRPDTIATMFGEPDFAGLNEDMLLLASRKKSEAILAAVASVERWHTALQVAAEAEERSGLEIPLPAGDPHEAARCAEELRGAHYLLALTIHAKARSGAAGIFQLVNRALHNEVDGIRRGLAESRSDVQRSQSDYDALRLAGPGRLKAEEDQAKQRLRDLGGPTRWAAVCLGLFYGVVSFLVAAVVALIGTLVRVNAVFLNLLLFPLVIVMLLGWLIVPLYYHWRRSPARARITAGLADHCASITSKIAGAEADARSHLNKLHKLETSAEGDLERLLATIEWLNLRAVS